MIPFVPEIPGVIDYVAVVLITVETNTDKYGNTTTVETRDPNFPRCLFEPEQSTERTDRRSPGVTSPAKLYVPPGGEFNSDTIFEIHDERWTVEGNPARWGNNGAETALKRWGPSKGQSNG